MPSPDLITFAIAQYAAVNAELETGCGKPSIAERGVFKAVLGVAEAFW